MIVVVGLRLRGNAGVQDKVQCVALNYSAGMEHDVFDGVCSRAAV